MLIFLLVSWCCILSVEGSKCTVLNECNLYCDRNAEFEKDLIASCTMEKHYTKGNITLKSKDIQNVSRAIKGLHIVTLILIYSNIKELKTGIFNNTFQTLSLTNNQIEVLQEKSIPMVSYLYLNENCIESIDANMFINISIVESLHLQNNRIKKITTSSFMGLNACTLELSHNRLAVIEDGSIPNVKSLYMNNNKLESIHSKMFVNVSCLSRLELSYNKISDLTQCNFKHFSLSVLILSYNRIFNITESSFSGLKTLTELSLTNNRIESIGTNSIPTVEYVNLSYNLLKSLEANMFSNLSSLQKVNIIYNCFQHSNFNMVKHVLIYNGKLNEKCTMKSYPIMEMDTFLISYCIVLAIGIVVLVVVIAFIVKRVNSRRRIQTSVSSEQSKKHVGQNVKELPRLSMSEEHIYEEIAEKPEPVEYVKDNEIYEVRN